MANDILGLEGYFYRNSATYDTPTWALYENVRDLNLNRTANETDVTTRANGGYVATRAATKIVDISFESVYDPDDTGLQAFLDAYENRSQVDVAVADGPIATVGTEYFRAVCDVVQANRTEPINGSMMMQFVLKPSYADDAPSYVEVTS